VLPSHPDGQSVFGEPLITVTHCRLYEARLTGDQDKPGVGAGDARRLAQYLRIQRDVFLMRPDQVTEREVGAYGVDTAGGQRQRSGIALAQSNGVTLARGSHVGASAR